MRTGSPDERQLMFLAFDLLHQDGVDLRGLPLSERKLDLDRLCRQSKVPYLTRVETFPDGNVLFDYCNKFGFEGIVSKRRSSPYPSGPSRHWVKVKCPNWKRINSGRNKPFEKREDAKRMHPQSALELSWFAPSRVEQQRKITSVRWKRRKRSPGSASSSPGSSSACDHRR